MEEIDKQLIKSSALVIADQIASSIPALNIAWGLSKSLFGAGLALRQQRALEWVEMIRDNPEIFKKEILSNENLQDGFVYAFEHFIKERSEEKRKIIKKIFLGFASSKDIKNFQLEHYIATLSLLTVKDISLLKQTGIEVNNRKTFKQEVTTYNNNLNEYSNLIRLGLMEVDKEGDVKYGLKKLLDGYVASSIDRNLNITEFGKGLIKFASG